MHLGHQGAVQALKLVEILQLIRLVFDALKVVGGVVFSRVREGDVSLQNRFFQGDIIERKTSIFERGGG